MQRSEVRLTVQSRIDVAAAGERTGGDERNREFASAGMRVEHGPDEVVTLAFDPQTAGGLLVSIGRARTQELETAFSAAQLLLARIGTVEEGRGVVLA